jgi:hypothetical protein
MRGIWVGTPQESVGCSPDAVYLPANTLGILESIEGGMQDE